MARAAAAQIPDRIRGFSGLAEHEAATYKGKFVVSEHGGFRFRRIWHEGLWWHAAPDVHSTSIASSSGVRLKKDEATMKRMVPTLKSRSA